MADAVTSQTLIDGERIAVLKFTNISDGSGESAVAKVDVSSLSVSGNKQTCTGCSIEKIWYITNGMKVQIFFDASSNVLAIELPDTDSGYFDYSSFGGITNNAGSGKTGDILFTTVGHTSADSYTIILQVRKEYV
jgi:hypothetical protein